MSDKIKNQLIYSISLIMVLVITLSFFYNRKEEERKVIIECMKNNPAKECSEVFK